MDEGGEKKKFQGRHMVTEGIHGENLLENMTRQMKDSSSLGKYWIGVTLLIIIVIFAASLLWIKAHPFPIGWDEAEYFNLLHYDRTAFCKGGILGAVKTLLFKDRSRPAAYRIFALPISLLCEADPKIIRLLSLLFGGISLLFIYLSGKTIAGFKAGALATLLVSLCPTIILASMRFGTEFPLYLAVSAMMYFLFRNIREKEIKFFNWMGLGLALGLGAWAKTSFLLIAGPVMILALILSYLQIMKHPAPHVLWRAIGLGSVVALPWWLPNGLHTLWFAFKSSRYARHTLGPPLSISTWGKWFMAFIQTGVGPAIAIILLLIIIGAFFLKKNNPTFSKEQKIALCLCFAGSLPFFIKHLLGMNHNIRLLSPALIPFALGMAIIAEIKGVVMRGKFFIFFLLLLFSFQLFITFLPAIQIDVYSQEKDFVGKGPGQVMKKWEQWNWEELRKLCKALHLNNPSIAHLGYGAAFNPPQIQYPWIKHNEPVSVTWLWRHEMGAIEWGKIMEQVEDFDIVLTAPHYQGDSADKQPIDNAHNQEFIKKLQNNPHFSRPVSLYLGELKQIEILIYLNNRHRLS